MLHDSWNVPADHTFASYTHSRARTRRGQSKHTSGLESSSDEDKYEDDFSMAIVAYETAWNSCAYDAAASAAATATAAAVAQNAAARSDMQLLTFRSVAWRQKEKEAAVWRVKELKAKDLQIKAKRRAAKAIATEVGQLQAIVARAAKLGVKASAFGLFAHAEQERAGFQEEPKSKHKAVTEIAEKEPTEAGAEAKTAEQTAAEAAALFVKVLLKAATRKAFCIFVFGNAQCGKSTFCNGLLKKLSCKTGRGSVGSITQTMTSHTSESIEVVEVPSVLEHPPERRAHAVHENSKALKHAVGKHCMFLFLCMQDDGQVCTEDRATMSMILEAAPEIASNYGIIVNKCHGDILKCQDDEEFKTAFCQALLTGLPARTKHIHFAPFDEDWHGEDKVPRFPEKLKQFLNDVPFATLTSPMVSDINPLRFEEIRDRLYELPVTWKKPAVQVGEARTRADERSQVWPPFLPVDSISGELAFPNALAPETWVEPEPEEKREI